jgi:hypothetical protein
MSATNLPANFLDRIRQMERRIEELERGANAREIDLPNLTKARVFDPVLDTDGNIVSGVASGKRGLVYPVDHASFSSPGSIVTLNTVATAFLGQADVFYPAHDTFSFRFTIAFLPNGATVEVKLVEAVSGNPVGNAFQISNSTGSARTAIRMGCDLIHPWTVGLGDSGNNDGAETEMSVSFRAIEIVAGSGSSQIVEPTSFNLASSAMLPNASATDPFYEIV